MNPLFRPLAAIINMILDEHGFGVDCGCSQCEFLLELYAELVNDDDWKKDLYVF